MGKKNEDCRFFILSTCKQGDACPFRHSEIAKNSSEVCGEWLLRKCSDLQCPKRHTKVKDKRMSRSFSQEQNSEGTLIFSNDIYGMNSDCNRGTDLFMNSCPMIREPNYYDQSNCLGSVQLLKTSSVSYGGARPKIPNYIQECAKVNRTMIKEKEPEAIGWACEECTYVNIPTRPGCEMCTHERPDYYKIPIGYMPPPEEAQRIRKVKEIEQQVKRMEKENRENNYKEILDVDEGPIVICGNRVECSICIADTDVGVRLRECLHIFCSECLAHLIETSETVEVQCPFYFENSRCTSLLQDREIRALVAPEVYARHLLKSLSLAETKTPNSFHCRTPDCFGWCEFEDNAHKFVCPVCKHENCINCKVIHEGMNCKDYQRKMELEAETKEEAQRTKNALEEMIANKSAMRCPKCNIVITKNGGCDGMKCIMCQTEICWATRGPRWGPAGHGDVSGGCRCRVNGQMCHPQCQNCH